MLDYVREPAEIYRKSFTSIAELDDIERLPPAIRPIGIRIVHACGMPDIVPDLAFSDDPVSVGQAALRSGADLYCDVDSVRTGVMRRLLPAACAIHCAINEPEIRAHAEANGMTRAAAQIDVWGEKLAGAVLVIGNAPTALFRLLENIDAGARAPALVLAFPVGFVGAAESKAELAENPRGMEFITLSGRRGGSAITAAAMNALAGGLAT